MNDTTAKQGLKRHPEEFPCPDTLKQVAQIEEPQHKNSKENIFSGDLCLILVGICQPGQEIVKVNTWS